jgi:hypothetical protein
MFCIAGITLFAGLHELDLHLAQQMPGSVLHPVCGCMLSMLGEYVMGHMSWWSQVAGLLLPVAWLLCCCVLVHRQYCQKVAL